jgi:type I restriction enzyme S subunit
MKLETFFEKFDQFADAPDAVAKMRELILGLAVQGRLVPQDPSDEPSTELVIRVALEKLRLVQKKEIKAESPTVPISGDEALFEIPSGWTWARAGDLCRPISSGSTPDQRVFHSSEGIPYLKVYNIRSQFVDFEYKRQFIDVSHHEERMKRSRLLPGDVIMNIVGPPLGKVAIVPDEYPEWNCNQAIAFFRPIFPEFAPYLYTFLKQGSFLQNIQLIGTAGQDNISVTKCKFIPIPLPPLAEQKRIVAKVDELMALCVRLEAQQQERETRHAALARASLARFADAPTPANLEYLFHSSFIIPPSDLRKSILTLAVQGKLVPQDPNDEPAEELFARIESTKEKLIKQRRIKRVAVEANPSGDECESLPSGWLWTRLGNSFDVRDGTHDTPKYTTEGFPLITSKNIYSGSLLFDGANLISERDHRQISERSRVDRGDILFAMIGSIGNPVIVDTDRKFSIKNVALFKYYTAADSDPRFLLLYLKLVAEEMRAKAAGGVQSFVSLGFLRNYLFPLPPLAEQGRIVAKVEQLMALVDALETQLAASRATSANLLSALVSELTAV